VEFLAEKVCFVGKENLRTLDFAKIEALCFCLFRCSHNRIAEGGNVVTEL
jgi:hypothetical protein